MQKSLKELMFYAASLLSMKSNTDISLLYFVSTTNKKLSRKNLYNLDIQQILTNLSNPPQPFALRLYSYLVVGVVRIYLFKLKAYENEVQSLLNTLSFKVKKIKKIKKGTDQGLLEDSDEDYKEDKDDDYNKDEGYKEDDYTNYHNDHFNNSLLQDDLEMPSKRHKLISNFKKLTPSNDPITEFPNCSKFCLDSRGMVGSFEKYVTYHNQEGDLSHHYNPYQYSVINKYTNKKKESLKPKDELPNDLSYDFDTFDPVEKLRSSSLMTYSTTVDQSIFKEEDWKGKIFNLINLGSRLTKVINFYVLLEKCSKGEIEVYQNEAYGEILLN